MQYTLRNIPKHVDRALRERAKAEGKSLNEVALEAIAKAMNLEGAPVRRRDLSEIAGSWIRDPKVEQALDEPRSIDEDMWT